jgi:HSP20 family protein
MSLIQYTPSRWFESAVNRVFSDVLGSPSWDAAEPQALFIPRVDVRDDKDAVVLSAEIPGVEKDGVTVEVNDGVLTLSGSKKQASESNENGAYRSERVYGEFKRSFVLPDTVDVERIDAQFRNGVLSISLPKKPEAAPKQIAIRGEGEAKKIGVN